MPQQPARLAPGTDVTSLMSGSDVTDLMSGASAPPPAKPEQSTLSGLAEGAMQGVSHTLIGLGELVHKIPGVSKAVDAFYGVPGLSKAAFPIARKAVEPQTTAQEIGHAGEQIGEFFLPTGVGGKLAKLAEVMKAGGLTMAQGGSPEAGVMAGVLTDIVPGAGAAAAVERSAGRSMIRALGPAGGRGPTGEAGLEAAEKIAPTLVKARFAPKTQGQARALAGTAIKNAGANLRAVLSSVGSDPADKLALQKAAGAARAALRVPKAGGGTYLESGSEAADALWAKLEDDIAQVDPTAGGLHALKKRWNDAVTSWKGDPATGSKRDLYTAGGNLIRAQLSKDSAKLSEADKLFHFASNLDELVNAANVRRPGAGLAAALTPLARPTAGAVIGGAEGYREGGLTGAMAGAATGAMLGNLIQSPGFRYVSAAMKHKLADALDNHPAAVPRLLAAISAQAAGLARAKDQR